MKLLLVGDVHATPEELGDCEALLALVTKVAAQTGATALFMGDQLHTHNIIRSEVQWFWNKAFKRLVQAGIPVMALVGNHDYAGEGLPMHAMVAYEDKIHVIDEPYEAEGVLFLPYHSDRAAFVRNCQRLNTKTLICHQTFDGAKYENGFYSTDGVDQDHCPQELILSGHIHTAQTFGKVNYIGAPRWRTLSDADVERSIRFMEFDGAGRLVSDTPFDTGGTCRQIRYRQDTPENPVAGLLDPSVDWRIDVRGPADWVEKRKRELGGTGIKLRTFKTEASTPAIRESDGVDVAFQKFSEVYVPKYGTDRGILQSMTKERLGV